MSDQALGATIILALASLTDVEREVVIARHMHGQSQVTVAAMRGTTRQAVHVVEKRGLRKLRERLLPYRDQLLGRVAA